MKEINGPLREIYRVLVYSMKGTNFGNDIFDLIKGGREKQGGNRGMCERERERERQRERKRHKARERERERERENGVRKREHEFV